MIELAEGLWQIPLMPRQAVNAYLIGDVVVDAGYGPQGKKVVTAVRGHEIRAHALTHVHNDHAGGSPHVVEAFGVPVWIGAGDAPYLREGRAPVPPGTPASGLFARIAASPAMAVDRELGEGDALADGWVVLDTPGHSPGHVSFWRESDRALVCGDVFFNMNILTTQFGLRQPIAMGTYDKPMNRRSERRLAELEPALVCFGHGPPLRDPAALKAFTAALPRD